LYLLAAKEKAAGVFFQAAGDAIEIAERAAQLDDCRPELTDTLQTTVERGLVVRKQPVYPPTGTLQRSYGVARPGEQAALRVVERAIAVLHEALYGCEGLVRFTAQLREVAEGAANVVAAFCQHACAGFQMAECFADARDVFIRQQSVGTYQEIAHLIDQALAALQNRPDGGLFSDDEWRIVPPAIQARTGR